MNEVTHVTWPLWQCLSIEALVLLIQYQWIIYGQNLDLMIDAFREVESHEEIDKLLRQRPHPEGAGWHG